MILGVRETEYPCSYHIWFDIYSPSRWPSTCCSLLEGIRRTRSHHPSFPSGMWQLVPSKAIKGPYRPACEECLQ